MDQIGTQLSSCPRSVVIMDVSAESLLLSRTKHLPLAFKLVHPIRRGPYTELALFGLQDIQHMDARLLQVRVLWLCQ